MRDNRQEISVETTEKVSGGAPGWRAPWGREESEEFLRNHSLTITDTTTTTDNSTTTDTTTGQDTSNTNYNQNNSNDNGAQQNTQNGNNINNNGMYVGSWRESKNQKYCNRLKSQS